jgi:hypothetical protein
MRTAHHLYIPADRMQTPVAPDLNTTKPRDISIPCRKQLALNGQCDVLVNDSSAKSCGSIAYSRLGSSRGELQKSQVLGSKGIG